MTNTGCLLATSDNEIGKIGPSLRVAARMRPYFVVRLDFGTTKPVRRTPRLASFSLATPVAPIVLTGPKWRIEMSESEIVSNQKTILKNQATIIANQKAILQNQDAIKNNQSSLDKILKNQELILAALKK